MFSRSYCLVCAEQWVLMNTVRLVTQTPSCPCAGTGGSFLAPAFAACCRAAPETSRNRRHPPSPRIQSKQYLNKAAQYEWTHKSERHSSR